MDRCRGFSIIEVLVVIFVVAVAVSLCFADADQRRRTAQKIQNNTQLRGIHQGMVIFAQANKAGSQEGYFPGLSPQGEIKTTKHGDKFLIMLEANLFTSEYIINPLDQGREAWTVKEGDLTTKHYSYALLQINDAEDDKGRHQEWRETINSRAIVLSDRNTKAGKERGSLWTDTDPEAEGWHGAAVHNDNSTRFEQDSIFEETKYGEGEVNEKDGLFEAAGAFDAMMTYGKAPEPKVAHR